MFESSLQYPRRVVWVVFGLLLLLMGASVLRRFIGPLLVGIFVYYGSRPLYRAIHDRIGHPTAAAAASLLSFAAPIVLLLGYTANIIYTELMTFLNEYDMGLAEEAGAQPYLTDLWPDFHQELSQLDLSQPVAFFTSEEGLTTVQSLWDTVLSSVSIAASVAINVLIVVVVAFYLLRDDHKFSGWLREQAEPNGCAREFAALVDEDLSAIFFGNLLNAFITGLFAVLVYTGLQLIAPAEANLSYPALIGLLAGLTSLIPIIGMKLVYLPVTGYITISIMSTGSTDLLWFPVVFFIVSLVVVDTIPDLFLRPYVSGKNIHIGLLILAYVMGPIVFGWYGLFLGPMLLALTVHFANCALPSLLTSINDRGRSPPRRAS